MTALHARRTGGLGLLLFLLCGCPTGPQTLPPPTGGLRLEGTPPDALVTIDEQPAGTITELGRIPVLLQPGTYRVQVSAPGCFTWYGDVTVGATVDPLHVELRPVPQ